MNYFFDYIEHFWISLSSFPFVIQIAIFFIFFSCTATLTFMIVVFVVRRDKARREKIVRELRPRIFSFLRNILISKDSYTEAEVLEMFVESFGEINKKTYISLIPTLEDVVKQEKHQLESQNYDSIISGLKIDDYLEKRLDFSNTRVRLRAFQSLSRLDLTISDSKILPHTYSRNSSLRKESRSSYVGVSNNDPFKFFDQDNDLNQWDQISLLQQFVLHHQDNLPNFSKWIKYSKDEEQIKFFIKLVAYFRQSTSVNALTEYLDHENHSVRKEAILAIGKMQVKEMENKLIKMYFTQPAPCQNAIVEAISYINSGKSIGFLKNAYEMANSHDLKKLIAEVIYLYGKPGRAYFDELYKTEIGFNLLILKHVENPLIPSALRNYHKSQQVAANDFSGSGELRSKLYEEKNKPPIIPHD
ncbi:HEAT repeat domain-containing protein [Flavobacterium salilacus subsp. salilacus]|uniref:HEAT repeat domain-containing protein n=1 Tax=Flavobacterium TaxID=237 RepID=UPI0013C30D5B|nr:MULTISPECIES: HEAT repeat domain-containing protein [Flavobacterium]KAF2516315.1 HEAT repeat domain-containing protein [Flavobacterium salilacus subsp. salilacus]MBE1613846.1 HEAT repeat domain-containing protein [Flavobacterium sp. SaA2.13]